jgi:heat shock protein HslJ
MEQESAYLAALETAATYTIQGDVLELRTAEDALVARYVVAPAATDEVGDADDTAGEDAAGEDAVIVGATWHWVGTAYGDDTTLAVDDPTRYTLILQPDGTVALQADCNQAGGAYTLDGALLSLDVAVLTRMACPEGSLADEFIRDLNAAATYVMDSEDLVINLFADAGNMRFVQAQ